MGSRKDNNAKIFINRVEGGGGGGHHGGAWKVAYADFVTAMMAFFLLMWLLNATTEKQRQGLADYFNPTVVQSSKGGGVGTRGGTTPEADENMLNAAAPREKDEAAFHELAKQVQDELTGSGAESMQHVNLLRHVVTRITDEGLVIELTDLTDNPLFAEDTAQPSAELRELGAILARVLGRVRNEIAIQGHVRSYPEVLAQSPVWELSDARAHSVRNLVEKNGLPERQVQRVTGFADRRNRSANPMDPQNNRIEVILLK
ncbi:MAG: flagellar motor protein MotB [Paracoccus sp. (in: a-proteobacteria)]|nr:flagellar motor protein MotB [Paracoccus sp. (in: a-proteobacteria)]